MKPPTKKKIDSEVAKLKVLLATLPKRNAFGEDIHAKVYAEITVLIEDLYEDEIYDRYDGEGLIEAALGVRRWLDGEEEISPSKSWAPVVKYGNRKHS